MADRQVIDPKQKIRVQSYYRCEETDDRCVDPPMNPPFMPGISTRHSPSCTGKICHLFACDGGNWRVTNQNTLDRSEWLKGWAMTQLLTRGFVTCEEHPLGRKDGGWWADAFRNTPGNRPFRSGSKLWALNFVRGGARNDVLLLARSYARQALEYLIDWRIASRIDVDAFYIAKGALQGRHDRNLPMGAVIQLHIKITGPSNTAASFDIEGAQQPSAEWIWQEYMPPKALASPTGRLYSRVY